MNVPEVNYIISTYFEDADHEYDDEKNSLWTVFFQTLLRLLAPFAPHIAHELWEITGEKTSLDRLPWLTFDPELAVARSGKIAVQINGKVRAQLDIDENETENEIVGKALELPEIRRFLKEQNLKKTIYIKDKILNLVVWLDLYH